MAEPTTPIHQHVASIQLLDPNLGRSPSQPTSHYYSSTKITDAKANLKAILATRVSYNDPNIVEVLVKPNKISDELVQLALKYISDDPVIMGILNAVRDQTVSLGSQMYAPLVCRARCSH